MKTRKTTAAFLFLIFLIFCSGVIYGNVLSTEREALIALYNSTNGNSWYENSGWKEPPLDMDGFAMPGTENTWYGITCDVSNTKVTKIALPFNNLLGTIPSELGDLSNLLYLYLNANQLGGSIPPELGYLSNLLELSLQSNQLTGIIPPELGNLSDLKVLELQNNLLEGIIPASLGNLLNLESLYLHSNWLEGNIPPGLGNLNKLKKLSLRSNELEGSIPEDLGSLINLETLYLDGNQFEGSIPPQLGNISKLRVLRLQDNQLTGSIPPELGNLSNLRSLFIRSNQLTGSIPPDLGSLLNLESLYLHSNQLEGSIPPELGNLSNLTILSLSSNQLEGSIPPELGNLSNLNFLSLSSNQLEGSIPPELGNLSNLNFLSLGNNSLYTDDDVLSDLLNTNDPDWGNIQTTAPTDVSATASSETSIDVSWTPIIYTGDTGGYRVFYSTTSGGPYNVYGQTTDKTVSSMQVTGLNPGTWYYFVVQTRTDPHGSQQNTVDSEYSAETSANTSYAGGTIPFDYFVLEKAKIDFKKKPDDDKIHMKGRFELGLDSDGVDISEDVIVTIGLFTETIKMEAKGKGDKWEYKRPKGESGIKHMKIDWKKKKKKNHHAEFDIRVDKADLGDMSSWTNPLTVTLQIGNDLGTEEILMKEKKHHWDYHKKKHH